jgi:hypothetical protein
VYLANNWFIVNMSVELKMRRLAFVAVILAGVSPAYAFDTFLPSGMGYSTSNIGLSDLSAADRAAIARADIYETEIYQRQLRAKQFDARTSAFSNDRNSDGISPDLNY